MTAQTSTVHLPSRRRTALLWLPTFAGFPLGGYAAHLLVGPVDSLAPAVAGGAITGAIVGCVQWLGMRRFGPSPVPWIAATAGGLAVGLAAGAAAVGYGTDTGALAVQGAICGLAVGAAEAAFLRGCLGRLAWAWPPVLAGLWALGWTVTASAGIDVESQYTVFGSSGALVVAAGTSVLAVVLADRRRGVQR